jgi:hypothetical protein
MTTAPDDEPSDPRNDRFQFSLATLLWLTLAVACALALLVGMPSAVAVPILICLAIGVPAVLTTVLVYGRGYVRAFCTGALFPTGIFLYATGWVFGLTIIEGPRPGTMDSLAEWFEFFEEIGTPYRVYAGAAWALGLIVGLVCVGVRRVALSGWRRSGPNAPR